MEAERQYRELTLQSAPAVAGAVERTATQREIPAVSYEVPYTYVDKPVYEAVKRVLDIILAIVGLVLASPIMLVTAIAIKAEDRGPVLYRHNRIGRNGKAFGMLKFRSMRPNAEKIENVLTPEQLAEYRINYKIDNDPRITRVGQRIRGSSVDEIPQFFNVLSGSMSMVGPRPVLQEETELYGQWRDVFLAAKPGITGYWQAYARSSVTYQDFRRQDMELRYVSNRSMWLDIKILCKTVETVLHKTGAK